MPGIVSGVILVFIPCLGSFLTPDLLGGANAIMIGNVIERQFKAANDWPFGSALSFLLMYATFGALALRSFYCPPQQGSGRLMAAKLKPGQGPLDYGNRLWLKILFGVIFFLLYAPIITLVAFSFNTDKRGIIWRGFTLNNYVKAWNNCRPDRGDDQFVGDCPSRHPHRHGAGRAGGADVVALPLSLQGAAMKVSWRCPSSFPKSAWAWRCCCSS